MILKILMLLKIICILPIIIIRDQNGKDKIKDKDLTTILAAFLIITSIINWFGYGSSQTGINILPIGGYYGNEILNITGLTASIIPPILTIIISYILYRIMTNIRYIILFKREKK